MLPPVTRLRTALAADCWAKCVSSPGRIENFSQLMIARGELVTVSVAASGRANVTTPLTTVGPLGLASAASAHASMTQKAIGRSANAEACGAVVRRAAGEDTLPMFYFRSLRTRRAAAVNRRRFFC